ncbi:polysaccharide lyase family 14 protein [Crepidotus variabilis]|uniref:Polysaccharide lyase family 14 protein n=1 Tax=Crepidotus variabilis TaxID=179855 RepID=A0A9P6JTB8_9AGAR|nr:polysaccharide lyase family 14 protein [Crepidotus variabilis]
MARAILPLLFLAPLSFAGSQVVPEAIASQYNLPTSTALPFPSATLSSSSAQSLLVSNWSLSKGHIQDGPQNLDFTTDPFPDKAAPVAPGTSSTSGPVLRISYPEGSFSHDTGGAQFYSLWNTTDGSSFRTMMVSYEIAFDSGFDWVKGGKLPGLRGGLNSTGCSGGNQATGLDCFSSRLMWRKGGAGEIYAYIPTPNKLCGEKSVVCNSDFGVSFDRGSFTFISGQITLVVQLNNPPNVANGHFAIYFNDVLAAQETNLQIRAADTVAANGFYFSTFFGGSDTSWATPVDAHTYFRNIRLWGSSDPSNTAGKLAVNNAVHSPAYSHATLLTSLAIIVSSYMFFH